MPDKFIRRMRRKIINATKKVRHVISFSNVDLSVANLRINITLYNAEIIRNVNEVLNIKGNNIELMTS